MEAAPALITINTPCSTIIEHFGVIFVGIEAGAAEQWPVYSFIIGHDGSKCIRRIFDYSVRVL